MRMLIYIFIFFLLAGNAAAYDMDDFVKSTEIHGFVSQGYLKSDSNDFYFAKTEDGTFQYNEIGINFITQLTDELRVGIQFLSRDLGSLGNNEIEIDWAYGDYRFRNWLGIRAGKIKRPYGLYNRSRDIDAARTFVFLPIMVYDDVPRDTYTATTGIGVYGYLPYGFSYELQYGTIQMDEEGGTATNTAWLLNTEITDIDADDTFTAYLEWETPLDGLKFAGTAFLMPDWTADSALGKLDFEGANYLASVEYSYKDLTLAAEYRSLPFEIMLNDTLTIADQTLEAWYVSASYQFTEWFTLGSYYGEIYSDSDDRDGDRFTARGLPASLAWRKDLALTTRFDINDYWLFKLEGHLMNGLGQVNTPPDEASEDWVLFAAKMTFTF